MFILEIKQGDNFSVEEYAKETQLEKILLQLKANLMKENPSYFSDYEKLRGLQYKQNYPYCFNHKGFNRSAQLNKLEREFEKKKELKPATLSVSIYRK